MQNFNFDWEYYVNRYSDLREAGISNRKRANAHWLRTGRYEKRYPNKFVEEQDLKNKNNNLQNKRIDSISLMDIQSMYSNANLDFSKSEQTSESQNINSSMFEDINLKLEKLNSNIIILYDELKKIHSELKNNDSQENKDDKQNNLYDTKINKNDTKINKNDTKINKSDIKKINKNDTKINQNNLNEKIVSSDEYDDMDENLNNEIKYSNSDDYDNKIDNQDEYNFGSDDEKINSDFSELSYESDEITYTNINNKKIVSGTINLSIDKLDDVNKKNLLEDKTEVNIIDLLIKDSNVNQKTQSKQKTKQKKKQDSIISLSNNNSSEESTDEYTDKDLKEITNLEHRSILNNILSNNINTNENENENENKNENENENKNDNKNQFIEYLNGQDLDHLLTFDNKKVQKLIKNINSKKK